MLDRVVVAIYIHPDYYPPTINAVNCLATLYKEVIIVTGNNCKDDYFIGDNIKVKKIGKYYSPINFEKTSTLYKVIVFLKFTFHFFKNTFSNKCDLILMYDAIPLFSFSLFKRLIKKTKTTWYHNHDMPNIKSVSKFSIGWFAAKFEKKTLQSMKIFSLPTNDRLVYYPNLQPQIKYFELPNFPSQKIYNSSPSAHAKIIDDNFIRIIYQGTISPGHAIEEVVRLLPNKIHNKNLQLTLKGKVKTEYKNKINDLAKKYNVENKLHWVGIGAYKEVQELTKQQHIGLAIHLGNIPQGTASNKIYEYAACGIPVIVYDNQQFRKHLGDFSWAIFTNATEDSLLKSIEYCCSNLEALSKSAKNDFNKIFYFEKNFSEIANFLMNKTVI